MRWRYLCIKNKIEKTMTDEKHFSRSTDQRKITLSLLDHFTIYHPDLND